MAERTAYVESRPPCDVCGSPAEYAKTKPGPWAYLCGACFGEHALGTGVGLGLRLIVRGEEALSPREGDLPRDELLLEAQVAVDRGASQVYFKFTCSHCGERCFLSEPNVLRESGECCACGGVTKITHGGFMLLLGPLGGC